MLEVPPDTGRKEIGNEPLGVGLPDRSQQVRALRNIIGDLIEAILKILEPLANDTDLFVEPFVAGFLGQPVQASHGHRKDHSQR